MTSAAVPRAGVRVRVPAKVNLDLRVGPLRPDGFHGLATVYQAVNLYDLVEVVPAADWSIEIAGRTAAGVPADETNLAMRAARALAAVVPDASPVAIRVIKEIPVAGGMAGGSADAAATLLGCHRVWDLDLSLDVLAEIAADLGSDVPFLLHGGTALGSGRGEQVVPVLTRGTYHWVFALADEGLSTPQVYAECDRLRGSARVPAPVVGSDLLTALLGADNEAVARGLANDLQDAAISLQPALGDVLEAGRAFGALGGIVSGSGPTVAFLARDGEAALDLAVALTASGVAPDVRRARGPVPGATVDAGRPH